jgi:hypothetical protein
MEHIWRKLAMVAPVALLSVSPATAQQVQTVSAIPGTRLDVVATGEVSAVPDIATIGAGVVTQAPTAVGAMADNGRRTAATVAAIRKAGVADRDIQTTAVNLNPQYRYVENQPPVIIGYQASSRVSVRFRDIKVAGPILDSLVAAGANQIDRQAGAATRRGPHQSNHDSEIACGTLRQGGGPSGQADCGDQRRQRRYAGTAAYADADDAGAGERSGYVDRGGRAKALDQRIGDL